MMLTGTPFKDVTEYTDYRGYLRDYIASRKAAGVHLSNRYFSMKLGMNSSSWLTSILAGKKGLSKDTANRLSSVLGHNRIQSRFFESLVFFNQARTLEDRTKFLNEMMMLRRAAGAYTLHEDQFEFYRTWHHSVVRSLLVMPGVDPTDFEALGARVSPRISAIAARDSVKLLERLGLIRKTEEGRYVQSTSAITTPEHHKSLAIQGFQKETMHLGMEALDRYAKTLRDVSTVTVGISEAGLTGIRKAITEFRDKVVAIANEDAPTDRVYQMNVQFFPLSATAEEA